MFVNKHNKQWSLQKWPLSRIEIIALTLTNYSEISTRTNLMNGKCNSYIKILY